MAVVHAKAAAAYKHNCSSIIHCAKASPQQHAKAAACKAVAGKHSGITQQQQQHTHAPRACKGIAVLAMATAHAKASACQGSSNMSMQQQQNANVEGVTASEVRSSTSSPYRLDSESEATFCLRSS